MFKILCVIAVTCLYAESHVTQRNSPNQLHPVHGFFVKPSVDGITGDLYVAATEDDGVNSQWLTDASINFLPATAESQKHETAFPIPFGPKYTQEESTNKKQTVAAPVQYAYAMPMPAAGSEGSMTSPYPYALPFSAMQSQTSENSLPCLDPSKANIPQYSPFHFFYPQMMSAYTKAMSILKDSGLSEETAGTAMPQTPPMWSPYSYPMYVMMDPSAWNQSQGTTAAPAAAKSADN